MENFPCLVSKINSVTRRLKYYLLKRFLCTLCSEQFTQKVSVYTVQCTIYSKGFCVHCTVYNFLKRFLCTLYCVQFTQKVSVYTVQCTIYSKGFYVHCTVYNLLKRFLCTLCSVQFTQKVSMYTVLCTIYSKGFYVHFFTMYQKRKCSIEIEGGVKRPESSVIILSKDFQKKSLILD